MKRLIFENDEGFLENQSIDPNIDDDFYLDKFPGSILVEEDELPNEEFSKFWQINNGSIIVDDQSLIDDKKKELIDLIKEDVNLKKQSEIIVSILSDNFKFDANLESLVYLKTALQFHIPINWITEENTIKVMQASDIITVITEIISRNSEIVLDGRRKKDLILAMDTIQELEQVDIDNL